MPATKFVPDRFLPDGSITKDIDIYIQAWQNLVKLSESIFTGYKCVACNNPGLKMVLYGKNSFGERFKLDSFEISIKALNLLQERFSLK